MMDLFNRSDTKERRRRLRSRMPPAEVRLWSVLRGRGILGAKFRRQYGVGPFVLDFYCPELHLSIELDGASHDSEEAHRYDRQRQAYIESLGIAFLRFTNEQVRQSPSEVFDAIEQSIRKRRGTAGLPVEGRTHGRSRGEEGEGGRKRLRKAE